MHVGDGSTHGKPDGESDAKSNAKSDGCTDAEPDACADARADARAFARADTCADAAPVRRRLARLRHDGGRHLLPDGTYQPHLRLQGRLLGEQQQHFPDERHMHEPHH